MRARPGPFRSRNSRSATGRGSASPTNSASVTARASFGGWKSKREPARHEAGSCELVLANRPDVPMPAIDLTASATDLREALLARRFSASDLLEASFARIDSLNPSLNAIIAQDREAARAMAAESDRRLADGSALPLEGLPITIKDAFDVAGLPSSGGLPAYKDRIPTDDAAPVARLRAAGVVIIGKTIVPVFSGDFQSYNPAHGIA